MLIALLQPLLQRVLRCALFRAHAITRQDILQLLNLGCMFLNKLPRLNECRCHMLMRLFGDTWDLNKVGVSLLLSQFIQHNELMNVESCSERKGVRLSLPTPSLIGIVILSYLLKDFRVSITRNSVILIGCNLLNDWDDDEKLNNPFERVGECEGLCLNDWEDETTYLLHLPFGDRSFKLEVLQLSSLFHRLCDLVRRCHFD